MNDRETSGVGPEAQSRTEQGTAGWSPARDPRQALSAALRRLWYNRPYFCLSDLARFAHCTPEFMGEVLEGRAVLRHEQLMALMDGLDTPAADVYAINRRHADARGPEPTSPPQSQRDVD